MSLVSFLKSATVEEVQDKPKAPTGGPKKQRQPNPSLLAVRLWKDGSVYPSAALIDKFDLQYRNAVVTIENIEARAEEKDEAGNVKVKAREAGTRKIFSTPDGSGNGFDVISSRKWEAFKGGDESAMLFVAAVGKREPKVDLFGSTLYDDNGIPKNIVEEQGAVTFGKHSLIPMVQDVYGIKLGIDEGELEYVDLVVFEEIGGFNLTEAYSKPIIFVPKVVARGDDKGKADYERRESAKVYGFAPEILVNEANNTNISPATESTVSAENKSAEE